MTDKIDPNCATCGHLESQHASCPQGQYCNVEGCGCVDGYMVEKPKPPKIDPRCMKKAEELLPCDCNPKLIAIKGHYFPGCPHSIDDLIPAVALALHETYEIGVHAREELVEALREAPQMQFVGGRIPTLGFIEKYQNWYANKRAKALGER